MSAPLPSFPNGFCLKGTITFGSSPNTKKTFLLGTIGSSLYMMNGVTGVCVPMKTLDGEYVFTLGARPVTDEPTRLCIAELFRRLFTHTGRTVTVTVDGVSVTGFVNGRTKQVVVEGLTAKAQLLPERQNALTGEESEDEIYDTLSSSFANGFSLSQGGRRPPRSSSAGDWSQPPPRENANCDGQTRLFWK